MPILIFGKLPGHCSARSGACNAPGKVVAPCQALLGGALSGAFK